MTEREPYDSGPDIYADRQIERARDEGYEEGLAVGIELGRKYIAMEDDAWSQDFVRWALKGGSF